MQPIEGEPTASSQLVEGHNIHRLDEIVLSILHQLVFNDDVHGGHLGIFDDRRDLQLLDAEPDGHYLGCKCGEAGVVSSSLKVNFSES